MNRTADRALGLFSIGLGVAEIAAPKRLGKPLNLEDQTWLLRAYGVREVATGLGLLTRRQTAPWLWARVGGDVLDLATLGARAATSDRRRENVGAAIGGVAGVTVVDLLAARSRSKAEAANGDGGMLTIERTITITKPADELYRSWRDPEVITQVMADLGNVTTTPEGRMRWQIEGPLGKSLTWETTIIVDRPGEFLSWASVEGASMRNEGSIAFTPAPDGWGTEVRLTMRFQPPGGPIAARAAQMVEPVPRMMLMKLLRRFKALTEASEIPTATPQPAARPAAA